jgi:hypothetical protein
LFAAYSANSNLQIAFNSSHLLIAGVTKKFLYASITASFEARARLPVLLPFFFDGTHDRGFEILAVHP